MLLVGDILISLCRQLFVNIHILLFLLTTLKIIYKWAIYLFIALFDLNQTLYIPDSFIFVSLSSYVHRVGRTARAGREGYAVTFVTDNDRSLLKAIVSQ